MEIKEEFTDKLNKLIPHWTKQGVQLNTGISIDNLKQLEIDFSFSFDEDFYTYLTKVNGFEDFDSDEAWFSFWSQNRIQEENGDASHPKEVIWFADYSINLCSFGFHKTDKKVYTHYQTIEGIECVTSSFSEFIDIYLQDPNLLLR
ncbi:MAG: hypothetical protein WDN26_03500 [Chitinophagaceae bacterium]